MIPSANIPPGSIDKKWSNFKSSCELVAPANRRKFRILVVGTGLAGASAASALGEQGYEVLVFTYHDTPRRAHSIAAQGGINAAKNYRNDGDSVFRLFAETLKGGDFRSREANVYRLAEISVQIIDHCVALGVPFARDYGGYLDTRSFGGTRVARTFYARGQTGQQLLLACYSSLLRQVDLGNVKIFPNHEMLDLVVVDNRAVGLIVRNLLNGSIHRIKGDCVILATGGYSNVYYLSTNARKSNASAIVRAFKRGAGFANPCFTQIHPTCIPATSEHQSKLTLMSESLRNDGRVWVPRNQEDKSKDPRLIPEKDRFYYLEQWYPSYGNLTPRDIASRAAKKVCDEGLGVGPMGLGVYLDFADAIKRLGKDTIAERYGNLFEMYQSITGENPWEVPMRIYPGPHYTMGGLWVDYNLMSTVSGLFVIGEANFSDHGANRLGASALMQGLADGFFIIPYSVPHFLATNGKNKISEDSPEFIVAEKAVSERIKRVLSYQGNHAVSEIHRRLGKILWDKCGMSRSHAGLTNALSEVKELAEALPKLIRVIDEGEGLNYALEHALRLEDFVKLGELMILDALERKESCGGHFREEFQSEDGEAARNDEEFAHVSVWFNQNGLRLETEKLTFEYVKPTIRSYK
ncbi:MAG: fumarate reductase/succinate dehydrogenase flavoprotein subunit [Deltaproteobacteria bacterium]|nr:fumarate reductase/succinate dehydrogenase flavoprotein subunit [Deltaproteobacteria bacterium]